MANHDNYVIQGNTLDAIASEVKTLADTSDKISPNEMSEKLGQVNTDVEAQADLIAQIQTALEGKAASGKEEQEKSVTITENGITEILPDGSKTLSKVKVSVEVESGGNGTEDFVGIKYSNFDSYRGSPKVADARSLPVKTDLFGGYRYLFANGSKNSNGGWHTLVEDFYLPDGISSLSAWMFYNCGSIKNIYGDLTSVTTIDQGCFQDSGLEKFDYYCPILTQIQQKAFSGCSNLIILTLKGNAVVSLANINVLYGTPIQNGTGYIYVPKALVEDYKIATNWTTYANQFRALEDYTVDGTITGKLDESKI